MESADGQQQDVTSHALSMVHAPASALGDEEAGTTLVQSSLCAFVGVFAYKPKMHEPMDQLHAFARSTDEQLPSNVATVPARGYGDCARQAVSLLEQHLQPIDTCA
jgi:hypothetical protein